MALIKNTEHARSNLAYDNVTTRPHFNQIKRTPIAKRPKASNYLSKKLDDVVFEYRVDHLTIKLKQLITKFAGHNNGFLFR